MPSESFFLCALSLGFWLGLCLCKDEKRERQ